MRRLAIVLGVWSAGCAERALDHCVEGDMPLHDLAAPTDLAGFDFAPLDLARPLCPAGARFIFTMDESRMLSRINPSSLQFFDVGIINCPSKATGMNAQPNSMAVARDGTAWVNYFSGELFRLDTTTAACTATPYTPGQGGLNNFGMSFAQNSPGSVDETLYIADTPMTATQPKLASVDLTTFTLSSEIDLVTNTTPPELTGDDMADLWGFFPDLTGGDTPFIARIDKTTGALDRMLPLPSLTGVALDWAFAAWGSDFYVFLRRNGDPSTRVYRVSSIDGSIVTAIANTGRKIDGVGVATCAADRD
jgi:hypothetical protein